MITFCVAVVADYNIFGGKRDRGDDVGRIGGSECGDGAISGPDKPLLRTACGLIQTCGDVLRSDSDTCRRE